MKTLLLTPFISCVLISICCENKKQKVTELELMQGETKIIELTQKIKILQLRTDRNNLLALEFDIAQERAAIINSQLAEMPTRASNAQNQISLLKEQIRSAEIQHLVDQRAQATGLKLPILITSKREYHDVTIQSISDIGLQITHSTGSTRIVSDMLSAEQLDQFGINPLVAAQKIAEESLLFAKHSAHVDSAIVEQQYQQRMRDFADQKKQSSALLAQYKQSAKKNYTPVSSVPKTIYRVRSSGTRYYYPYYYNYNYNSSNYNSSNYNTPAPCVPVPTKKFIDLNAINQ